MGEHSQASQDLRELALGDVRPDPEQHRQTFDDDYIRGLADSIREQGQRTPIEVRPDPEHAGGWLIISGECRFRALTLLGAPTVRALVNEGLSESDVAAIQGAENLARNNPLPTEEGRAHRRYMEALRAEDPDLTETDLQRRSGEVHGRGLRDVREKLALLDLPEEVGALVDAGAIGQRLALALLPLVGTDEAGQVVALARRAAARGWTVEEAVHAVAQIRGDAAQGALFGDVEGEESTEARATRGALRRALTHYERAAAATFDQQAQGLAELALDELTGAELAGALAQLRGAAKHLGALVRILAAELGEDEAEEVLGAIVPAEPEGEPEHAATDAGPAPLVAGPVCIRREIRGSWLWVYGPGAGGSLGYALAQAGGVWCEKRGAWYAPTEPRRERVEAVLAEYGATERETTQAAG